MRDCGYIVSLYDDAMWIPAERAESIKDIVESINGCGQLNLAKLNADYFGLKNKYTLYDYKFRDKFDHYLDDVKDLPLDVKERVLLEAKTILDKTKFSDKDALLIFNDIYRSGIKFDKLTKKEKELAKKIINLEE